MTTKAEKFLQRLLKKLDTIESDGVINKTGNPSDDYHRVEAQVDLISEMMDWDELHDVLIQATKRETKQERITHIINRTKKKTT